MFIGTETGDLWSFRDFCRSEYAKPVVPNPYGTNQAMDNERVHKAASQWVTYARVYGRSWRIAISLSGEVSFLTACDQSKTPGHYVNSRYNTRAGVIALGRLLGSLIMVLRHSGGGNLSEVSFDPESPSLGMAFRHIAKNPLVLDAFELEGYLLTSPSDDAIRFQRQPLSLEGDTQ